MGNFEHRFLIYDSIVTTKIKPEAVLLEPESKNTLAAITLSALHIHKKDPVLQESLFRVTNKCT